MTEIKEEIKDYGEYLEKAYEQQAELFAKREAFKKKRNDRARGGNKARKSKDSIYADAVNLLIVYEPIFKKFSKIDRIDGVARDFKQAVWGIIKAYKLARECPDTAYSCVQEIFKNYGILDAGIEVMDSLGLLTNSSFFAIADRLDRIEEGVRKWKRSLSASGAGGGQRTYGSMVLYPNPDQPQEPPVTIKG